MTQDIEVKKVNLFDICRPKQWKTISTKDLKDSGYPVYGANGKIGFFDKYNHEHPTLLITCRGATCGALTISDPFSYVNGNAMCIDDLSEDVDIRFLYYFLLSRGFDDTITGSAQPQITRQTIAKIQINLPSLAKQKEIVSVIDKTMIIGEKRKKSLKLLEDYLDSTFVEMFGDIRTNPKKWDKLNLKDITLKITDGTHQSPKFTESGIPFIFISNIVQNEITLNTKKYISEQTYHELTKSTPIEKYDILYTTVGSYGHPAIVKTDDKFCFQRHIAHIKPDTSKTNVYFLYGMLKTPYIRQQADEKAKGVAQKTLNLGELNKFQIILPPMDMQNKYADIVAGVEKIKEAMLKQLIELDNQSQSFLQSTFSSSI